ncbi:DUF190 domain-containing protein [Fundidesulfovibrio butyratiphilus]
MEWSALVRLRIYLGEQDTFQGESASLALVKAARAKKLHGATVIRGVMGYGKHSLIHTAKILRLSDDLPLIVEILDEPEAVESFLDDVLLIAPTCLVTREQVEALLP